MNPVVEREAAQRLLERFARGEALAPEDRAVFERAASEPLPVQELRKLADILRVGERAAPLVRAVGSELFRSQNEFNHLLVDALEDRPWHASAPAAAERATRRLREWSRLRVMPPRRGGTRGTVVWLGKSVVTRAAAAALLPLRIALLRSNEALSRLPVASPSQRAELLRTARAPLLARSGRWARAQVDFVDGIAAFLARPEPTRRPLQRHRLTDVSVVLVGAPREPWPEGVLEVLCESVPVGAPSHVKAGDVQDARGKWILRIEGDERWTAALDSRHLERLEVQLVYGDVDIGGARQFRPGWSPEYLWSESYVGGTFLVRTDIARRAELSRATPALEWLLRPRFGASAVCRVPEILSTRDRLREPDEREDEVLRTELSRRGLRGRVTRTRRREVRLAPVDRTRVSIIVPFKDRVELLEGLWHSLCRYDAGVEWELILASNASAQRATFDFLRSLNDPRVRWFEWNHDFNYSAINNAAARFATGELLLFLNNDVEVRHDGWLADLAGYAQLPEVTAVGARLLYADGGMQHGGVAIGLRGLAGHVFWRWRPEYGQTPFGWPDATRNWSAVTGACLMMRKAHFDAIGGFDERIRISGGDVELCLRAAARGGRTVCVGHVELFHFESISRGQAPVPRDDVRAEVSAYLPWLLRGDPYFHPQLPSDTCNGFPGPFTEPHWHALRAVHPRLDR